MLQRKLQRNLQGKILRTEFLKFCREFYFRLSLIGGLLALLLISSGPASDLSRVIGVLKPDDFSPAPVAEKCEPPEKNFSLFRLEKSTWCRVSAQERSLDRNPGLNLDRSKNKNIF